MRKKGAPTALVTCLILVIAGIFSQGLAGEVHGNSGHATGVGKRPENRTEAARVATGGLHRCRSKKIRLCGLLVRAKQNDSTVDDDKRVVPTGPNPLHNR
ncbi:hypothetical protein GW17_00025086 [Ensete ventricosum]|nr:hypothetical protein GW17_00025086 [Ensete ventricosum]RZS27453.1 hypothetical protein BHM03_00060919 [Ensete ventricosum]